MTGSADIPSRPPSPASTRRVPADIDNGPRKMEDTEKEAVEAFRSGLRKHKSCNDKLRLPALRDDEWLDKLINELRDAETHMRLRPVRPDTPIEPGNFVFLDPSDGGLFCRVMDEYDLQPVLQVWQGLADLVLCRRWKQCRSIYRAYLTEPDEVGVDEWSCD